MTPSSAAMPWGAGAGAAVSAKTGLTESTARVDAKSVTESGFMRVLLWLGSMLHDAGVGFVQNEAFDRVDGFSPGFCLQHALRVGITGVPARTDSVRAEIDVARVVFAMHLRRKQANHMHAGKAAIARDLTHEIVFERFRGQTGGQLGNDVAQAVDLALARDMRSRAARILEVLLAVHHLQDRVRLGSVRIPEMDCEDERVLARLVVEHGFDGCVGKDAAIPIELPADADGGESGGQRARRHHMLDVELLVAAVEIAHRAGADIGRTDGEARRAVIDLIEIDQLAQRALERRRRVVARLFGAQLHMWAEMRAQIGFEEAAHAGRGREECRCRLSDDRERTGELQDRFVFDALPKCPQAGKTVVRLVAGDLARVYRADRGADDPIGLDAGFVKRLVDAGLIRAECASALKHQNDLPAFGNGACALRNLRCNRHDLSPVLVRRSRYARRQCGAELLVVYAFHRRKLLASHLVYAREFSGLNGSTQMTSLENARKS